MILVGERAAQTPGLLTAVGELVDATGAALAWVPRRAGERGALDAGALGNLLPGGRPVTDPAARAEVEKAWGASIPERPGRDAAGILDAVGIAEPELTDFGVAAEAFDENNTFHGEVDDPEDRAPGLAGLLIGGVEISDLPDPAAALAAVASAGFVVSLEIRASAVTELANVVFPVAAAAEKSGAYINWEGRLRPFQAALPEAGMLDEARILDTLGVEMDVDLYTQTPAAAMAELARLGRLVRPSGRPAEPVAPVAHHDRWTGLVLTRLADQPGRRPVDGRRAAPGRHRPATGGADLADGGARLGVVDGEQVTVRGTGQRHHPAGGDHRDGRRGGLAAGAHRRHRHRRQVGCAGRRPGLGRAGRRGRKGTLMSALYANAAGLCTRPRTPSRWAPTDRWNRCSPTTRGGWG